MKFICLLNTIARLALMAIILLPIRCLAVDSPSITTQPDSQNEVAGSNAVFTVVASGKAPLHYHWSFRGTNLMDSAHISGATNTTLTVSNVIASDTGNYQVVVTNSHGSATSSNAILTVLIPPAISNQPTSHSILLGSNVTFAVTAVGTDPLSYQWYFHGVPMAGQNGTNLPIIAAPASATGVYYVVVTNMYGSATSSEAFLAVDGPPAIITQPTNIAIFAGGSTNLETVVGGVGPLNYQWLHNGTNLAGVMNIITTMAGNGNGGYAGDDGASISASLNLPAFVAMDVHGNFFIADQGNNVIREVESYGVYGPFGIIRTVAGNGNANYSGDGGAATNATLSSPTCVAIDAYGNLFIADQGNQRIRKVDTNGIITTVAGSGNRIFSGDGGAATNADLNNPCGVAVDATGNLFITDQSNNRIRKVDTNGIITTVAGGAGGFYGGYSGDGGAATNAQLNSPYDVTMDVWGNLFISDQGNAVIREVNTNGIITTVAGNGRGGPPCNGCSATNSNFYSPSVVAVDVHGNLLIADPGNHLIEEVATNGILTTVAGKYMGNSGDPGSYSGDGGAATNAVFNKPCGVAVDANGNLFIADRYNNRIRKVTASASYPVLTLTNLTLNDAGTYQIIITNAFGSVTSSIVTLTVNPPQISIVPNLDRSMTLNLMAAPNVSSRVWVATNLTPPVAWQSVFANVAGTNGTSQFIDTSAISNSVRFYRCSTP